MGPQPQPSNPQEGDSGDWGNLVGPSWTDGGQGPWQLGGGPLTAPSLQQTSENHVKWLPSAWTLKHKLE